uniref:Vesicular, overexpressed in cancer, prosurvival protein 1 n=1 Tax=Scylla olivacea TaxID=85551 RepID=A0A0N7ZCE5_SCYOL
MLPAPLTLLAAACLAGEVAANYCEWDLCGGEQYCCGDNLCCDYVNHHWYFWVGVVFMVLLVSACGGLFRYYYHRWTSKGSLPPYLPAHISPHDSHFKLTDDSEKGSM